MKRSLLLATAALGVAMLPLGAANAQGPTPFDNPGLYFGVYAGAAADHFKTTEEIVVAPGSLDQFVAGFIVGDRFKRPPDRIWSGAIEGELGFLGGHNEALTDLAPGITSEADGAAELIDGAIDICGYDHNSVGRVRFLAGLPSGNVEPFGAIGVAITDANVCYDSEPEGGTFVGLTLGAGVNIAVAPNFLVRPEVLYDIYGKKNYGDVSVGLQTFTARVAAIFKFPAPPPP